MTEKVTKLALASRVIVLIVQLLANAAISDHKPDVFRAVIEMPMATVATTTTTTSSSIAQNAHAATPTEAAAMNSTLTRSHTWLDKTLHFCLGGLRHWDGEYFLHIAEHTYSYENTLAFYPLYPLLVRTCAQGLHYFGFGLSLRSWCLLVAALINILCFCKAANILYALTQRIFNDLNKSWNAALLFCFNPASIFFTAAYSEAIFAWITFYLMLECVTELRFVRNTIALALCIVSRSNGLVNAAFPVYFILRKLILKPAHHLFALFKIALTIIGALLPLTFFYFYAFQQFCQPERTVAHTPAVLTYARNRNYILAGHRQPQHSPWCDKSFPFPYSYIQSHYWNVGFLRYYEFKQLPNFMLALPILTFLFYHCYKCLKHFICNLLPKYPLMQLLKEYKSIPFVVHVLFLTSFCTLFVHIQISTRLLCSASPCLYWFAADHLPKTFDQIRLRSKAGMILLWFALYYLIGTILFSNNLPWT